MGTLLLYTTPADGTEALPCGQRPENMRALIALPGACEAVVPHLEKQSHKNLNLLASPLSAQLLEWGCHSEKNLSLSSVPPQDSEILPGATKQLLISSQGRGFICNSAWRSLGLRALSKTVKVVVREWGQLWI